MKLGIIHPFLLREIRGIERYTLSLSNSLAELGVDVHILTWGMPNPVLVIEPNPKVKIHRMPVPRYYAARAVVPMYLTHLLRNHYDLLQIHFACYGEAEAVTLASKVRPTPFNVVFHYPYPQIGDRYQEFFKYDLIRRAARIVSVSSFIADGVRECFGMDSTVIPNGVDVNLFKDLDGKRERTRRQLQVPDGAVTLLTIAALEESKGIQYALRALPRVLQKYPDVQYWIRGSGSYQGALETMVKELKLESVVRFLPPAEDITTYYAAADMAILFYQADAFSLALLEVMASGLPVIAANKRPFTDLLTPETGIVLNEQDPAQVAEGICRLISDRAEAKALGARGRDWVYAKHTWEQSSRQYLDLFETQLR